MWRNVVFGIAVAVLSGVLILMVSFAWRMFRVAFGKKNTVNDKDRSAG